MSIVTYKEQQYDNETSKTTTINSVKFNTNIKINKKQNNSTDNISVKRFDTEKINKRKHLQGMYGKIRVPLKTKK